MWLDVWLAKLQIGSCGVICLWIHGLASVSNVLLLHMQFDGILKSTVDALEWSRAVEASNLLLLDTQAHWVLRDAAYVPSFLAFGL